MKSFCDNCGIEFNRKKSQLEKYKNNYCSRECRKIGMLSIDHSGKFKIFYDHINNEGLILCTNCGEYKDDSNFSIRNNIKHRNCREYFCKDCVKSRSKKSYIENKDSKNKWKGTIQGYLKSIIQSSRHRKKDILNGVQLSYDYIKNLYDKQNGMCNLSGVKMTTISGQGNIPTNISLDRIDSSIGYIEGNIQLVCRIVNTMKTDLSMNDFKEWCRLITNKLNDE